VGNPYPSYLNWDAVAKTSVQNTIWTRAFEGSEMVFKTYNAGVQEGDDDQTNGHIAPLQAFWVKVPADKADENDLTVEFTNTLRLHKVEGDANLRASKANNRPLIRLQISNGVISDKTVILFDGNAQNGFDAYDSEKMSNDNAAIPEICTSVDGERLVINSLTAVSDDLEIPLGIKTGTAGTFGISAVTLQNLEAVTLIDKVEDCEFDLSAGEAYEFASGVTDNAERFVLAFRAPQTPTGLSQSGTAKVLIYSNGNQIIITGAKNLSLVEVFNVAGQKLVGEQTHSAFYILHSTFSKGVYFVKVGNETSKIIVE
jgi:hypothetical protein